MKIKNLIFILPIIICVGFIIYKIYDFSRGNYQTYCPQQNYSIFSEGSGNKIILGCAGSHEACEIRVIDPVSMDLLKIIPIDGLLQKAIMIENGNSIVALLSEIDGLMSTQDGKLVKIDYETGTYLDEYAFPDRTSVTMVADSLQEHVFAVAGYKHYEDIPPLLYKFNIADFSIDATTEIGEIVQDLEITNDDQKLYMNDGGVKISIDESIPTEHFYQIYVYHSSDLGHIAGIDMPMGLRTMSMGYDNRLYIGHSTPALKDFNFALTVIDTQTDQIIETYGFGPDNYEGVNTMKINPLTRTLYCTTYEYGLDEHYHSSSQILKINLDDYSYEFLPLGIEPKWQLAVAYDQNFCRVFCTSETAPNNVFYIDQ